MCGGKNYTNARCSETIGRKLLFRLKKNHIRINRDMRRRQTNKQEAL